MMKCVVIRHTIVSRYGQKMKPKKQKTTLNVKMTSDDGTEVEESMTLEDVQEFIDNLRDSNADDYDNFVISTGDGKK